MKQIISSILILLIVYSCTNSLIYRKSENGDLIFVEATKDNLSGAIDRATKNDSNSLSYDHIGIIEKTNNKTYILHSSPKNGSEKIGLNKFIRKQGRLHKKLALYRLKDKNCSNKAVTIANTMLNKPYNFSYIQNDNSYYCSDFVERAFRNCNVFDLQPMNFKNLKTGEIDEYWIDYYKNLKMKVPQGLPGTNPNAMSRNKKLNVVIIER
ncbi:MAG: hypothetical protein JST62_02515 [Bacteroidetes bacterium]|nr:hypothetical protein [Bacteroidota bacterium]